ncbi:MAG: UDP-N-acetylmuramate dehydrogenase [Actinomycetota bacterium]|nr:UDP-N-acetylmuramate dehydrogenase [Actinomycetota bacterium]
MASTSSDLLEFLSGIVGATTHYEVPMSEFTTWRVGGPAKFFTLVETRDALLQVLSVARSLNFPIFVLGNGSNVLVSDRGFEGLVIRLVGEFAGIRVEGERIDAGSGALLGSVVAAARKASLGGLEFAFGIPGTVGGAVMMNAGAFGGSISDVLEKVVCADYSGRLKIYEEFSGAYRTPLVPAGQIVVEAVFSLERRDSSLVKKKMENVRRERVTTQPLGMPTAGSVFKNPPGESAGRLIEECGLRGKEIGGASISEEHANFIVNTGGASASDIKALIDFAMSKVKEKFGIDLELEVQLVGFTEEERQ